MNHPKSQNLKNFLKLVSKERSEWLEKAEWRTDNEYWLATMFRMAVDVLTDIRSKNISKEQLKEMLLEEHRPILDKFLKGSENVSISFIKDIERALNIELNLKSYKEK